jgi:ABC-type amino acid transport system permease subunit
MIVVRCTRACLGLARSQRPRLVLAPVALRVLAPRDLSQMCKYETLT